MKLELDLYTSGELNAAADFLKALASARGELEKQPRTCLLGCHPGEETPVATPAASAPAETTKKSRAKKEEPAAAEVKKEEPAAEVKKEEPNLLDKVNEVAAADAKADAGVSSITHDAIRKVIGDLSQAGKRNDAVAIVRNRKNKDGNSCNGVGEIQDKDLAEIHAALLKLKG